MKRMFLMAVLAIVFCAASAQVRVVKDAQGNYISASTDTIPDVNTGLVYKDSKGNKYPIYKSARGKYYVKVTAKTSGRVYRKYLAMNEPVKTTK